MSQRLPFPSDSRLLEAAHIIPLSLNGFEESRSAELVGPDFSLFKSLDCLVLQHKAAVTWDMLRSWTGIDLDKLVGSKINTPENAILMCREQHLSFGRFKWYLDKDAVCCLFDSLFLTERLKTDSILTIQISTRHKGLIQAIDFYMERSL